MSNKTYKILATILASFLAVVVLMLAQDITTTSASPQFNPATTTPVPTEVPTDDWYWTHEVVDLVFSHPGLDGTHYGPSVIVSGADDVEAAVFEIIKRCPSANNHWSKNRWEHTDGGSWAAIHDTQLCDVLYRSWWENSGGQNDTDTLAQITTRFGSANSAGANTRAESEIEYQVLTAAGGDGGTGYTSELDVYYLHYGSEGNCFDEITIGSESFAEGVIDATLEEGLSEPLAEGGNYAIEISGGPWDDGYVSRSDVAYSWDGAEWQQLDGSSEDAYCVEDLATGGQMYYIEAQANLLYLRVNDEADSFDDNADDMDYKLFGVVGQGETGCGRYYTLGAQVFEEEWAADFEWDGSPGEKYYPALINDSGVYFENYDIYRILIPHTYQDGAQYNAEAQLQSLLGGSWVDLATHERTVCVEDHDDDLGDAEGWIAYYFESPEDFTTYRIRADDLDGETDSSYDNNSGGFAVEVYAATYNPPVAGCAANFTQGPLIQNILVSADAENGIRIPDPLFAYFGDPNESGLLVDTAYMIEEPASWAGFTSLGSDSNLFDWQISADRSTWWDIEDFAGCIDPIDNNHSKYYFDADVEEYYIRAVDYDGDGSWIDQPGWISLNLYYADDLRTEPEDNGECPNLALGDVLYSGHVGAEELNGGNLPAVMSPGLLYGIRLTTPPWTDDSVDQKVAEFKLYDDATWQNFEDYDGAFCSERDGNDWPLIWIKALDNTTYQIRADDSIVDNDGYINYTIYEADWIVDPIYPSCEGDYNQVNFGNFPVISNEIPAQWQNGQHWKDYNLRQGVYQITTSGGPWTDLVLIGEDIEAFDLEISISNGAINTWFDLATAADCYVPVGDYARAYITIPEGYQNLVRLRVNNQDDLWIDNIGQMNFEVQYSDQGTDPDDPWDPYGDDDRFFQSGGCYLICVRPGSALNVPAWLEYFRCQLIRRLSFCPYHIDALEGMRELFYDREPFGSLQELGQSFGLVRQRVDSYQWSEDQGGDPPDVSYPENFIFASPDGGGANIPIVGDDTIWGSGEIDLMGTEGVSFDLTCTNNLAATLGDRLSQPMCFAFNIIDALGLSSWFQLFWDLSMLIALSMYFNNRWLKPMSS